MIWLVAALPSVAIAVLALIWSRDQRILARLLRQAGSGANLVALLEDYAPLSLSRRVLLEIQTLAEAVSDRTAMVDRLLRAEESIVERLPDPLIVLGPDRQVRRANAAARVAFGAEMQAVLRQPKLRQAIDRVMATGTDGQPQTADIHLPVPVPRDVQAILVALDSPISGGGGVLAVLSDRTRERAVERMRADFVANSSHELRTPLASLIGFIATLRGPAADDPPAQKRFLEIMAEQAERMNRLIDDLLSLSRIEITEHQAPADSVDFCELVSSILEGFEIRFQQRGTRIVFSAQEDLPNVIGDTDQLEQVVQNLVDNALKYGKQGGVVQVALVVAAQGGKYPARPGVVLSVADDGVGIPKEHIPRLTERFYRVDTGRSRAVGGTGLGLAIVKHIVSRHRGVLAIDSDEGQGAKFSVWLAAVSPPL